MIMKTRVDFNGTASVQNLFQEDNRYYAVLQMYDGVKSEVQSRKTRIRIPVTLEQYRQLEQNQKKSVKVIGGLEFCTGD